MIISSTSHFQRRKMLLMEYLMYSSLSYLRTQWETSQHDISDALTNDNG